jgi:HAD superfamily hydrolase (TIGR01509 family)
MKALIFDFDGLILDTELPDYQSWASIYQEHGHEFPLDKWATIVGGTAASDFDPHAHLEELAGRTLDREAIWVKRRKQYLDSIESQPVLPGVEDYLDAAGEMGLNLAVASSSPENWVVGHLTRLGLLDRFALVCTADDVERTKPAPDLFLKALEGVGASADEAIVFEDSPNGVMAASRAGIFCVAVPNELTVQLSLEHADMILNSLADIPLGELLKQVKQKKAAVKQ